MTTTPTPSQSPLSAGAVPELPVVAWRCTQSIPDDGKRLNCVSSNAAYVAMHSAYNWQDLTPKAPAQATIDALRADLKEVCELGLWRKSEMERLTKELAAIKAKQVAEAEAAMDLADDYAVRYFRNIRYGTASTIHEKDAAREALRAALTKDCT